MDIIQTVMSVVLIGSILFFALKKTKSKSMKKEMVMSLVDANEQTGEKLTFQDVAGNDEAKESIADIVDFIKNPDKYEKFGCRVPHGVIFYGAPGTGKTLMAKAVAGEAGVPFYAVSGSDFVEMYVGVGANRVRQLFKKAKSHGKAVIFIDEIDALGKKRNSNGSGGSDERDQTLNALLTEMSGFSSSDGVVVIAATNRIDTLDSALLRPGRFDRQIEIALPDVCARFSILTHHAKNKTIANDVDLREIAKEIVYFSGAMIENYLNEAAILCVKGGKDCIDKKDLEKAYFTIIAGSEKKNRENVCKEERNITAVHEAGHALIGKILTPKNKISKVSIIPSTKGAGGFCVNIAPEKMFYTKAELKAQIMVSLAGRAAEEILFGAENITTGASNDIERATSIAFDFVCKYGMGDKTGLVNMAQFDDKNNVLNECRNLIEQLYEQTKTCITENLLTLKNISNALIEFETLDEIQLNNIVAA